MALGTMSENFGSLDENCVRGTNLKFMGDPQIMTKRFCKVDNI